MRKMIEATIRHQRFLFWTILYIPGKRNVNLCKTHKQHPSNKGTTLYYGEKCEDQFLLWAEKRNSSRVISRIQCFINYLATISVSEGLT